MDEQAAAIPPALLDEVDCHADYLLLSNVLDDGLTPLEGQEGNLSHFTTVWHFLPGAVDDMSDQVGLEELDILHG